ncbi:hypothetical protein PSEUDO8Z_160009 [Pseudomonas sp. 8Z]|nr:hypothetical protein PSEUDO8Z_160009 [Pseudomonas sp. 8Z]
MPNRSSGERELWCSVKFRLGTWTCDEILSGYWANEVVNRQDADPMHFVSSVLIPLAKLLLCQTYKSPLSEGFCMSGGRFLFNGRR